MNIRERYRRLSLWNKIAFWGSIASFLSLGIPAVAFVWNGRAAGGRAEDLGAITAGIAPVTGDLTPANPLKREADTAFTRLEPERWLGLGRPSLQWAHRDASVARLHPTIDYTARTVGDSIYLRPASPYLAAHESGEPLPAHKPMNEYSYFYANPPVVRIDVVNGNAEPLIVSEVRARVHREVIDSAPLLVALAQVSVPRTFLLSNEGLEAARNATVRLEGWSRPKVQNQWDVECGTPTSILLDGRQTQEVVLRDIMLVDLTDAVPRDFAADSTVCVYVTVTFDGHSAGASPPRFGIPVFLVPQFPSSGAPAPGFPVVRLGLRAMVADSVYRAPMRLVVPPQGERAAVVHILSDHSARFQIELEVVSVRGAVLARRYLDLRTLQPKTGTGYFKALGSSVRWLPLPANAHALAPSLEAVGYVTDERALWVVVNEEPFPSWQGTREVCEVYLKTAAQAGIRDSVYVVMVNASGIGAWRGKMLVPNQTRVRGRELASCAF